MDEEFDQFLWDFNDVDNQYVLSECSYCMKSLCENCMEIATTKVCDEGGNPFVYTETPFCRPCADRMEVEEGNSIDRPDVYLPMTAEEFTSWKQMHPKSSHHQRGPPKNDCPNTDCRGWCGRPYAFRSEWPLFHRQKIADK